MIKIIKDGQKDFIGKCHTCGCEFSYQLTDIGLGSVVCPCCGGYVRHKVEEFEGLTFTTRPDAIPCGPTQQTIADWTAPDITVTSSNFDPRKTTIHNLRTYYDGFNTVEGLKSLINDIRGSAEENLAGKERG